MSIIGIGADITQTARIEKAAKESFLRRYFTEAENLLFANGGMCPDTIAAAFAAKEAFAKALGTGFSGISPREIETLRDGNGRPFINVYGGAKAAAERLGVKGIHVTLTHEGGYALAFVVLEK